MSDMANAIPSYTPFSAGQLRGRARGALICGFFGAAWMFEAVFFGGIATPAWLTITTLFTVAFLACPIVQLRSFRHLTYSLADRHRWTLISTLYWTDFAVEWLACAVAVIYLVHIRRFDLIPQSLGVIIGLHFLPLAKLFNAPIYYATGAAMVLGALASLLIPAGSARNLAACGINGLCLWVTAAIGLYRNSLHRDEESLVVGPNGLD